MCSSFGLLTVTFCCCGAWHCNKRVPIAFEKSNYLVDRNQNVIDWQTCYDQAAQSRKIVDLNLKNQGSRGILFFGKIFQSFYTITKLGIVGF